MPKIIILDGHAANPGDLSWAPISQLGELSVFPRTKPEEGFERAKNADILIVNKFVVDENLMSQLPQLKLICTLATGYNNIDVKAAAKNNITVCNAVGYSSPSVAQHVFALLLKMTNHVAIHNEDVHQNGWANAPDWCYWKSPLMELAGKTMGIYGFGKIGRQTAKAALGFGMKVLANRKNMGSPPPAGVDYVSFERLLSESDVLSLHAPLSDENKDIINTENLSKMKPSAILINTGRGGLVNELDLKNALENKIIAAAGLDVLSQEPPPMDHPLVGLKNCIITPHQAWASMESRNRLIQIVAENIQAFLQGHYKNVVHA